MNKRDGFDEYCRFMYDENCYERWHHGQQPYQSIDDYVMKNKKWLQEQYQNEKKERASN